MVDNPTRTGLDELVEIIETDYGLQRRLPQSEIDAGAQAANDLNRLILRGTEALGLVNDGAINSADLRALGEWVQSDSGRYSYFTSLYGTNRNGNETGFQLVEQDNGLVRLFGASAIDEIMNSIYSFGFGSVNGQLIDNEGKPYRSLELTAGWLDQLLTDTDKVSLYNPNTLIDFEGTTGTGLDRLVDVVNEDVGLAYNLSSTDIAEGARAVDSLNRLFLTGIEELGLANDLEIDFSDVRALDEWVQASTYRSSRVDELRGSSEDGSESGYQLIAYEGARTGYIGIDDGIHPHVGHVVNHVFRGLFQVGNGIEGTQLLNEDGVRDNSVAMVAAWLDQLLTDGDMRSLENTNIDTDIDTDIDTVGTTGTGLDRLVDVINADPGILRNISSPDIAKAARAADKLNHLILDGISVLGLADDLRFDGSDLRELSDWVVSFEGRQQNFEFQYGTSNSGAETGFQLVEGDGGSSRLFGEAAINEVADGIYSFGFGTIRGQLLDVDGDPYRSLDLTASWVERLLTDADMFALRRVRGNLGCVNHQFPRVSI